MTSSINQTIHLLTKPLIYSLCQSPFRAFHVRHSVHEGWQGTRWIEGTVQAQDSPHHLSRLPLHQDPSAGHSQGVCEWCMRNNALVASFRDWFEGQRGSLALFGVIEWHLDLFYVSSSHSEVHPLALIGVFWLVCVAVEST